MVYSQQYPGDVNFLDSIDSYMRKIGVPMNLSPQERLTITEQARNTLYSYDVQCLERVAVKILESDLETDNEAKGLWIAFKNHVMDPIFVQIMMQYLYTRNTPTINGRIGALLSRVVDQYVEEHWDPKKKGNKDEAVPTFEEIDHIKAAIETLLGQTANNLQTKCGNLNHIEALFIAACLAMNSKDTISEILRADTAITADIFKDLTDPDPIIRASLKLLKADVPTKPTKNQEAFLESLKRWIFDKLNDIPGGDTVLYQYLVDVYGSVKPDVSPYYIQIKDCGTTRTHLLTVAKQIVNK